MSRSDKYAIVREDEYIKSDDTLKKYIAEQKKIFNKDPYFEEVIVTLQAIADRRLGNHVKEELTTDDMYDGPSKDSIIYMEAMDKNSKFDLEPLTEQEKCTALAPIEYENITWTESFKSKKGEDLSTTKRLVLKFEGKEFETIKSKSLNVCEMNKKLIEKQFADVKSEIDEHKKEISGYDEKFVNKVIENRMSNRKVTDPKTKERVSYHSLFSVINSSYRALKARVTGKTLVFGIPVDNALIYNGKVSIDIITEDSSTV